MRVRERQLHAAELVTPAMSYTTGWDTIGAVKIHPPKQDESHLEP